MNYMMKMTKSMKTLLTLAAVAFTATPANAATMSFGTMNTTGDGTTGWAFANGGADSNDNGAAELPAFVLGINGTATGTSAGDTLASGDYTISFLYARYISGGTTTVQAYAWDGSIQTALVVEATPPALGEDVWGSYDLEFSVGSGSPLIGQQLQLKFSHSAISGYEAFDTITGDFVAVPEPSTTALLGLGGLALILRRRK